LLPKPLEASKPLEAVTLRNASRLEPSSDAPSKIRGRPVALSAVVVSSIGIVCGICPSEPLHADAAEPGRPERGAAEGPRRGNGRP